MKSWIRQVVTHPFQAVLYLLVVGCTVALLATPYAPLAVVPSLAVVAFFLIGLYPQFWYYVVVFLVPFGAYRSLEGPLQFVRLHWFVSVGLLGVIFLEHLRRKTMLAGLRSRLWPLLGLFAAVFLVSGAFSSYRVTAAANLGLLLVSYLFFALGLVLISPEGMSRRLPGVIVVSASIGSLLAILGSVYRLGYFSQVEDGHLGRAVGGSTDPNHMAMILLFTIPFLLHWMLYGERKRLRLAAALLLALNLMGLVTTFSRGGALVLAVLAMVLLVQHVRNMRPRHLGLVMAILAAVLALIPVLVPKGYWERQRSLADPLDMSISRRVSYVLFGGESFAKSPILGAGPGSFADLYAGSEYARRYAALTDDPKAYKRAAHNTYLEVAVGTGLVGLLVFLAILWRVWADFSAARRLARERRNEPLHRLLTAYQTSYLSLLLFMLVVSQLYNKYLLIMFAASQVALRAAEESRPVPDELPRSG